MKRRLASLGLIGLLTLPTLAYSQDRPTGDKPIINPTKIRRVKAGTPIPHTSVKDQGHVGFCWSYSGMGLIESEYLKSTGKTIDLNEEYIGFHHVYDQVIKNAPTYYKNSKIVYQKTGRPLKDLKGKTKTGLKNAFRNLMINFLFGTSEGAPNLQLVMDLAQKYGVVTEAAFDYKVTKDQEESVKTRIMNFVNNKLRNPEVNKSYFTFDANGEPKPREEKIFNELARAYTQEDDGTNGKDGRCDSCALLKARDSFEYNGNIFTPHTLLRDELRVNLKDFSEVMVGPDNFSKAMEQMERSLDQGTTVQLGVILLSGFRDAVKGEGKLMPENCGKYTECKAEGGHAILAVNKTVDPKTGKMNGVIIKNSWGPHGLDKMGKKTGALGYQIIFLDYLKKLYDITKKTDSEGKTTTAKWFMHIPNSAK